jgi:hypothetical protein
MNHFQKLCRSRGDEAQIKTKLETPHVVSYSSERKFNHHHAQADAEAAGRVLLAMMCHANAATPRELFQKVGMKPERF